jgi:hypothetical protein
MALRRVADDWRRRALALAFALIVAAPGPAYPCTMEQLLSLPFECLLQFEFTPPGVPHRAFDCIAQSACREAR